VNRYGLSDAAVAVLAAWESLQEAARQRRELPPGEDDTSIRRRHRMSSRVLVDAMVELDRRAGSGEALRNWYAPIVRKMRGG